MNDKTIKQHYSRFQSDLKIPKKKNPSVKYSYSSFLSLKSFIFSGLKLLIHVLYYKIPAVVEDD